MCNLNLAKADACLETASGNNMKTLIIFLTILIGLTTKQTINEKDFIGSWTVTKSINESNKQCDMNSSRVRDFKLTFLSVDKYEQTDNYGTLTKTKGTYSIDKKKNILTLKFKTGDQIVKLNVPIITSTKDVLTLQYNLCGLSDTTSVISGRLDLKKSK